MTTVSTRILTIPNALSTLRLLLVPVFLVLLIAQEFLAGLITLVIASLTDFVDGAVARRFNQITRLGQLLDPAADRLYVIAALLGLAGGGVIPWWIVAAILSRELMLIGLGVALARNGFGPLPSHHLGKLATFTLLLALPTLLVSAAIPVLAPWATPLGWAAILWGAYLYWAAGFAYIAQAVRLIRGTETALDDAPAGETATGDEPATVPGASDTLGAREGGAA